MVEHIAYFFSAFFMINAIPHYVSGVMGNPFPTPFAKPPGVGNSSPVVNVLWGTLSFVGGYALLAWAGFFQLGLNSASAAWAAGFAVVSLVLATTFGKRHTDKGASR